ncbi:aldo/keto reductase (plasmid) [Salipiger sp. H15]|uniref:Aldo/keto reductase n=1 Tax=Alloyangia sp. H15 TaxID=3029062 RepID=A0AAU8AQG3_9RHOB
MTQLTTRSETPISRMGYGAMQFGRTVDEDGAREMFRACTDVGINIFDTAFSYEKGESERILGKLVSPFEGEVIVATKAPNDRPASADNLRDAFAQSRQRLGLACIDIYYLHRFDPVTPLEETFGTLAEMQSRGEIRHIGVSNFAAWQIMKAQAVCAKFGTRIEVCQPMYNLVKRQVEVEILPACNDQGIAVCAYSPLGGGLLTGKYAEGARGRLSEDPTYASRYGQPWMHEAARGLSALAQSRNVPAATLAVAWGARNPGITSMLISARNTAQLQPSLDALNLVLPDDLYAEISALSPEPPPATDRSERN